MKVWILNSNFNFYFLLEEDPKEENVGTNEAIITDESILDTATTVFDLATIEEQPELGYQSDSEGISHVNSAAVSKLKERNGTPNLDTVAEDTKEFDNEGNNDNKNK